MAGGGGAGRSRRGVDVWLVSSAWPQAIARASGGRRLEAGDACPRGPGVGCTVVHRCGRFHRGSRGARPPRRSVEPLRPRPPPSRLGCVIFRTKTGERRAAEASNARSTRRNRVGPLLPAEKETGGDQTHGNPRSLVTTSQMKPYIGSGSGLLGKPRRSRSRSLRRRRASPAIRASA